MSTARLSMPIGVLAVLLAATISAAVNVESVPVGNRGNAGDLRYLSDGMALFGSVGYPYDIGAYEITAGQYAEFLNAAAATDTYGLYNTSMWSDSRGCKIQQSGLPGSYTYSVAADWAERPVNFVSWGDAARFANWLHNSQPTGAQGPSTTEDGSYELNGATSDTALMSVTRGASATWVIPSRDEWYKAAYHKNDGVTGNYWEYPTSTDSTPSNDLIDPDPGNNANFYQSGFTIGGPYYRTEVGEFENSDSPYGTFDQGGNVAEWTEWVDGTYRGVSGGFLNGPDSFLTPPMALIVVPTWESDWLGFRVAVRRRAGDCERDGDVDLDDYAFCAACLSGPSAAPPAGCVNADMDTDTDVDLADFARFQRVLETFVIPPGMVLVPGGEFQMGDTFNEGWLGELPVHAVFVDAFYMDSCELTNAQYAAWLNWAMIQGDLIMITDGVVYKQGSGTDVPYCSTTSAAPGSPHYGEFSTVTWDGSSFGVVAGKENHPMVNVSWYGAVAFANWRSTVEGRELCYDLTTWACNFGSGYRLPTEAEWEKAARGGAAGRRFPWSDTDTIQHARANHSSYWVGGAPYYAYDTSSTSGFHPCWGTGDYPYTSPVGFFTGAIQYKADWGWPGSPISYPTVKGANDYGLYDMAGNVSEWCNDRLLSATYYSSSPSSNPTGPGNGVDRIVRDGSWRIAADASRCARRGYAVPSYRYGTLGFRLVLDSP